MKDFYFTFGFGQIFEGGYHKIAAETKSEALEIMFSRFGPRWAFCYPSAKAAGVSRWGLFEVFWNNGCPGVNNV